MTELHAREGELLLPVGTVTLLLADVEGSTRLWEAEPETMTATVARLDEIVAEVIGLHGGVRPVEQGEGDSFVAAFARASDAVAAALDLQRADTAPIRLRIGIHTGEVQLRDEGNYIGSAVNRCARLRNIGHGGQTVLSQATHDLVIDRLPAGASLLDLGTHRLRDLARPERVHQLCHPELQAEFPPLRSLDAFAHNLPVQLTSFVGRRVEMAEVAGLLRDNRLVSLTGSGGAGKTRLALQVAADLLVEHPDGVWLVELASITDPGVVPVCVARSLGFQDEPARSTVETITYHVGSNAMLIILDNCEHVIGACATLAATLLRACPSLTVLATSREPLGVDGEVRWRVPSLTLPARDEPDAIAALARSEAVQLFAERARRSRPDFDLDDHNTGAVAEICQRLDGIPLAIELAAARIRAMSAEEIAAELHDRFQLLDGGARTAVPRQQTLRASVDWSHDLLTQPERVLFRRVSALAGTFDLAAAKAVGAGDGLAAHQVLDQLALLVDKSLVVAEETDGKSRYRLLETVRQYGRERLEESDEAHVVRRRHRDHYLAFAEGAEERIIGPDQDDCLDRLEAEFDNLRLAFEWSRQSGDAEPALQLALSLFFLWMMRSRVSEGRAWLDAALADGGAVDAPLRAKALAVTAFLDTLAYNTAAQGHADDAIAVARDLGDPYILARALNAAGWAATYFVGSDAGARFFQEAIDLVQQGDYAWVRVDALCGLGLGLCQTGDPALARPLLEDAYVQAQDAGDRWMVRGCQLNLGIAALMLGDLAEGRSLLASSAAAAEAVGDGVSRAFALTFGGYAMAMMGEVDAARQACHDAAAAARDLATPVIEAYAHWFLGVALLAEGEAPAARQSIADAWNVLGANPGAGYEFLAGWAEAELAAGDIDAARRRADEAVALTGDADIKFFLAWALVARAHVALLDGEGEEAENAAHRALAIQCGVGAKALIADTLELLASVAAGQESHAEAARLYGAADALRRATGYVRFAIYRDDYKASICALQAAMGSDTFARAWAEGAALSLDEAVAYAQRGRGERKRPSAGWASLTPAEHNVVRLVAEGLTNKAIAERLFISPRTVQTHLTHVYTKLDVTSRVQLAKQATHRT